MIGGAGPLRATPLLAAALAAFTAGLALRAQEPFEASYFDGIDHPAIGYATEPLDDAVTRLSRRVAAGTARLTFEDRWGYLRSLLEALQVPQDSQLVVFSKTSLQAAAIAPRHPRMIYFNDHTVVAWPREGFIEIATHDPRRGVIFYMLEQRPAQTPVITRPRACLTCHVSYATLNVPGMLTRSVGVAPDGRTLPQLANATPDHRTPFAERWGGWYVSGRTGAAAHLGNATIANPDAPAAQAIPRPSSLAALTAFDTTAYLTPYSDVAALLVFDHQTHMMNLITRVGWQARVAMADADPRTADTLRAAAEALVDYALFVDEARLPGPVEGTSGFTQRFSAAGPRDRQGRSLRQLDLTTRLMRYPCSYLIYSEAFDALPDEAKAAVYARLWAVLSGAAPGPRYARLTAADRTAIIEILRDTKADLPAYFRGGAVR